MRKDKLVSEILGDEVAFSPADILNQTFSQVALGGYSRQEVDAFVERVAGIVEELLNHVRALKEKADQQDARLEEFHEMESTLHNALASSQRYGEELIASARREADLTIREAKFAAEKARREVVSVPAALAREIERLERQRNRMRAELLAVLDAHRNLLHQLFPATSPSIPPGGIVVVEENATDEGEPEPPATAAADQSEPEARPAQPEGSAVDEPVKSPADAEPAAAEEPVPAEDTPDSSDQTSARRSQRRRKKRRRA